MNIMKRIGILAGLSALLSSGVALGSVKEAPAEFSEETKQCIKCHSNYSPPLARLPSKAI